MQALRRPDGRLGEEAGEDRDGRQEKVSRPSKRSKITLLYRSYGT